ncbi:MAG: hypothetical protein GY719_18690 [bacterium]|nr:hypothetical protein [bacterium]
MNIEEGPIVVGNGKQVLSLLLRSVAYEYSRQRYALTCDRLFLNSRELAFSPNWSPAVFEIEDLIEDRSAVLELYLERRLAVACRIHEQGMVSAVNYVWCTIPENIGVSCCAAISPLVEDSSPDTFLPEPWLSVNIVPTPDVTHFIASWLCEFDTVCRISLQGIESRKGFERLLNRIAFLDCEDTCISPRVWDRISSEERLEVQLAVRAPMYRELFDRAPLVIKIPAYRIEEA